MTQRVALVTGVSSGIGRATAEVLSRSGFRTFGTLRDMGKASKLPAGLEAVQLDVLDADSVRAALQSVVERGGRIDALVNNAGYMLVGAAEETSLDEARAIFETNVFGVLRMCNAVLPIMRDQGSGRIVNITSVLGFAPAPYMALYAATKHAIEGCSESLDHEVRHMGIRSIAVEPSFTRTNLGASSAEARVALPAYAVHRSAATRAIRDSVANGEDPRGVAAAVLRAVTERSPRVRYLAGREARMLRLLRTFAPVSMFDWGLRRKFGLTSSDQATRLIEPHDEQ